jgi:hypothetical protein
VANNRRRRPCPGCGDMFDSQFTYRKCPACRHEPARRPLPAAWRIAPVPAFRASEPGDHARPRLLDLFCGAGGAAAGYHRAGFDVTGVDIAAQPRYPFAFVRADAMTWPLGGYDAIHASPPCQAYARVTGWRGDRRAHPELLPGCYGRLAHLAVPWVVENVPEALPCADLELCGTRFGLAVRRHRRFLAPWMPRPAVRPCGCRGRAGLLAFTHKDERAYADAMGCYWMSGIEAREAVPPAYTEHIGGLLMSFLAGEVPG